MPAARSPLQLRLAKDVITGHVATIDSQSQTPQTPDDPGLFTQALKHSSGSPTSLHYPVRLLTHRALLTDAG
ncbi:unnamed protein product [Pleuronectes platessa]|uniref:Uncharacterized protein n=1 Tax=Pleuronectes platessa TaxID=8262 RepID=A0A9N7V986_PLEPL|nr:unnamed protein product [Pleuronectes platessa]